MNLDLYSNESMGNIESKKKKKKKLLIQTL